MKINTSSLHFSIGLFVIIGSVDRKVRNAKAAELLSKGFLELGKRTKAVPKGTALPADQVGPVRPSP